MIMYNPKPKSVRLFVRLLLLLVLLSLPVSLLAQSDFGLWYSVGAEKKIDKKWTVGVEGEFRTRNNGRTADRWDVGVSADYKIVKGLKASVGYDLIYQNMAEKITFNTDGSYNNWRPSFWTPRHRFHADLTGSVDVGRFKFSLRERWQYTYRPEATTTRYDFDNSQWEETTVSGRARNVLRSRLQVAWNPRHCPVDPYANVELFNSWNLTKTRYTLGADWRVAKHHLVGLYYRYQHVSDASENQPNEHIVGLNYKFKF